MAAQTSHSLDGVVRFTEVDEEVPVPVIHGQQVLHALQVHGQQTGPTPDGGKPLRCDADIGKPGCQLGEFSEQVLLSLRRAVRESFM